MPTPWLMIGYRSGTPPARKSRIMWEYRKNRAIKEYFSLLFMAYSTSSVRADMGARSIMEWSNPLWIPVRTSKSGRMVNNASGKCLALKSLLKTYMSVRGMKMWVRISIFF